jgi:DNA-binding NarL/FixJ family response regulator
LDAVLRGELGLEGDVLAVLVNNTVRLATASMGLERSRYDSLTPREKEVFRHVALNAETKKIATDLNLSLKTIENMKSTIYGKLELTDRFELYKYALRIGVIEE